MLDVVNVCACIQTKTKLNHNAQVHYKRVLRYQSNSLLTAFFTLTHILSNQNQKLKTQSVHLPQNEEERLKLYIFKKCSSTYDIESLRSSLQETYR